MTSVVPSPPWLAGEPIPRRRRHRIVFTAAGIYNIAWGLFSMAKPQWLFELAGMEPANHPQIFATLGMVIGLYGIIYLAVAAYLRDAWPRVRTLSTQQLIALPSRQSSHGPSR